MKTHFRLSYSRIKRTPDFGNTERCKVLRHLYARKMFAIYSEGTHVINIDESWIAEQDFRRRCWHTKGKSNTYAEQAVGHKVNIIVAVSSQGKAWLALT